MSWCTQWI